MRTLPALAFALLLPACASNYSRDWMASVPVGPAPLDPVVPAAVETAPAVIDWTGYAPYRWEEEGAKKDKDAGKAGDKPATLKKYYAPQGGYIGASMLYGFEQFDVSGAESASNSRVGFSVRGGWRIPEGYAAELVFEDANDFRIRSVGGFDADLDLFSVGVQGKYFFSKEQTQPYFMAGFGVTSARVEHADDDSGAYFRMGGGFEHYFKDDMAFFFELKFDQLMGELNDLDHFDIQAGVIIFF